MTLATEKKESEESEGGGQAENGSGDGGLFGFMKKSGNNASTRNSRNKKSSNKKGGQPPTERTLSQRKVLKAIPPPAEDRNTQISTDAAIDTESDRDIDRDAKRFALPGFAPSVEGEAIRELSEKTRKERLGAAASKMKEHKEKGLDQRRRSGVTSSGVEASGSAPAADDEKQRNLPDIFSVQPKFPEHKRNVEKASLPEEEAPLEKKYKVDSNPGDSGPSSSGSAASKSWGDSLSAWIKIAVPSVAIAAVAAIIAIKVVRKK